MLMESAEQIASVDGGKARRFQLGRPGPATTELRRWLD